MDNRLKQRTVGAIAFALVAIIVLPMLLDGSREEREQIITSIPESPDIPVRKVSVAEVRERMDAMERASANRLPREVVDETDYSEAPNLTLDKNQLPVSWSLQVASFREQENAVRLRQKLRDAGYHTYVLHALTGGGDTYRVLVGPMIDRDALTEISARIESEMNLKGQLVRYKVEDDVGQLGGGEDT